MAQVNSVAGRVRWPSGVVATLDNDRGWTIEGDGPENLKARAAAAGLDYPGPEGGFPGPYLLEALARAVPGGKAEYDPPEIDPDVVY